jgi:hypothetical protein
VPELPPNAGLGLDFGPDLQRSEVVPVLLESGLFERKDDFLSGIEVSVTRTDNVGENDEAAARHLVGVNDAPALFPVEPSNGPRNGVLVLGHSTNLLEHGCLPHTAGTVGHFGTIGAGRPFTRRLSLTLSTSGVHRQPFFCWIQNRILGHRSSEHLKPQRDSSPTTSTEP